MSGQRNVCQRNFCWRNIVVLASAFISKPFTTYSLAATFRKELQIQKVVMRLPQAASLELGSSLFHLARISNETWLECADGITTENVHMKCIPAECFIVSVRGHQLTECFIVSVIGHQLSECFIMSVRGHQLTEWFIMSVGAHRITECFII